MTAREDCVVTVAGLVVDAEACVVASDDCTAGSDC